MASNRLEALRAMVAQDPANAFARYGLAMELSNSGALDEAAREFRSLLADQPDYVPGYFHAGQTFERLGLIEEARSTYEAGMVAAGRKGDLHTKSELQGALELLPV